MKKLALRSLWTAILLTCTLPLYAQKSPTDVAVDESVRREALQRDLTTKLQQAADAQSRGAIRESARLYTEALDLAKKIGKSGPGAEGQYIAALDGFTSTRLLIAEQAQRVSDYAAADDQYALILRENPNNQAVVELRKKNNELLVRTAGMRPSAEAIAQIPGIVTNKVEASTFAQNAKMFYEAGRLDESEANARKALELDPGNRAAAYYLPLIQQERFRRAGLAGELARETSFIKVQEAWSKTGPNESPQAAAFAKTNMVYTSKGRQQIYNKLDTIRLNDVSYDSLPLGNVIEQLNRDAKNRDPQKRGINFLLSANIDPPAAGTGAVDPATGLPVAAAGGGAAGDTDISSLTIKLMPALTDVSLREVLDAIIKVADRPIKYSVEDYAIVISHRAAETPPLYTRWYKIDPNTFLQGMQGVASFDFGTGSGLGQSGGGGGGGGGGRGGGGGGRGGGAGGGQGGQNGQNQGGAEYVGVRMGAIQGNAQGGGQQQQQQQPRQPGQPVTAGTGPGIDHVTVVTPMDVISAVARQFFTTAGVDFTTPGKTLVFNDRLGMLMVRASLADLDIIEQAVQVLNMSPPQISLEAKMMEVTQDDLKALGFDWFFGNWKMGQGGSIVASGGSAPSMAGRPGSPAFPDVFSQAASLSGADVNQAVTAGLRNENAAPAIATITGILTDPQFRVVIRALDQRRGINVMATPKVTTMSGRQAQIKAVEVRYIVVANDLSQTGGGGTASTVGTATGGGGVGSVVQPIADVFELGPVLDVVPYVSADGFTIQMTIIPTVKQFVGYDLVSAALFQGQAQSVGGVGQASAPLTALTPLPIFRLRQVVTSAIVWDGQTVVLGGLLAEDTTKNKDKVPVLGDLPFVGKFFQSQSSQSTKKNLMIFVTPTIIDPAGNRVHTDEDMPFSQNAIPAQPKPVTQPR